MPNVVTIVDCLKEAIKILEAYQFPREERARLALGEIEKSKRLIKEWEEED